MEKNSFGRLLMSHDASQSSATAYFIIYFSFIMHFIRYYFKTYYAIDCFISTITFTFYLIRLFDDNFVYYISLFFTFIFIMHIKTS